MGRAAPSFARIAATALALFAPPGCVLVSSNRNTPPVDAGVDTGIDAQRPDTGPAPDAADAGEVPDTGAPICERADVLADIANDVILPTYRRFDERAAELEVAVSAYATSSSEPDLEAAREAWRRAVDAWQEAELMQIGPAGMTMTATAGVVGGMDLRDQIYSWDYTNRCRIDQETASGDFEDVDAFAGEQPNVRGLDAMEYLLFFEDTSNGCTSSATINTSGQWAMLVSAGEIPTRRARYARTLAVLVRRSSQALLSAWDGGFGAALASGGAPYSDVRQALNAVSDAMISYADRRLKDLKIAALDASLSMQCPIDRGSCPEYLESRWADRSREHMLANLRGLRAVFLGGASAAEGAGFDDLLACHGCVDAARALTAEIDAAIEAVEAMPPLTAASLASQLAAVEAAFDAVKAITDTLKTDFLSCLGLSLPRDAEGDTD